MNRLLLISLVVVAGLAGCQTATVEPATTEAALKTVETSNDANAAMNALLNDDQPLRAFSIMEKVIIEQKFMVQLAAQYSAFLGRESLTRKLANARTPKRESDKTISVAELTAVDAIHEVTAAATPFRVVIINESHTDQRQRAFAHMLAKALRTAGFTHLGFEAIATGLGAGVNKNGPVLKTAFYGADPLFADFMRNGVAIGYTVFDYEPAYDSSKLENAARLVAREKGQAANIKKVLDANPSAKALIYVGGGHGSKAPQKQDLKMMARELMDMLGTNVLSIDQQTGTPQSERVFDLPRYQAVESALRSSGSTVFRNNDGKWLTSPGYDMILFHPRMPEVHGRGAWMSMDGYRKLEVVNVKPLPTRTLVRARAWPLQKDGIAMDQVLIDAQARDAALYLPIGDYALFRETESGVSEQIGRVTIK